MKIKIIFALALAVLIGACINQKNRKENMDANDKAIATATPDDMFLLVGTYTSDSGKEFMCIN